MEPSFFHLARAALRATSGFPGNLTTLVEELQPVRAFRSFAFRSFAFRDLAFAAAFDALVALSRRCFAVNAFARAWPPRLPISDMTLEISSSSAMMQWYTVAAG